jgi:hypothetical protein
MTLRTLAIASLLAAAPFAWGGESAPVTFGTLLGEMADLARLARRPEPAYRTVQFSSYDRRSRGPEDPGWFENADGFGGEPIPGFLGVLREPRDGKPGLYLLAEVEGPGAISRGWSAGMDGVLRVHLDPARSLDGADGATIWEGKAYDFLARRSEHLLKAAGIDLGAGDAFIQQDADYLPVPFAKGLRVTWEGDLHGLHFYHLQVRRHPEGTAVRSFDPARDLKAHEKELRAAVAGLVEPPRIAGEAVALEGDLEPGRPWKWSRPGPGAVTELRLRLRADPLDEALRGTVLRISFDGSSRPQVESPVGDFFASGPGVNPFSSLPFTVAADGTMTCRFVMPFAKGIEIEALNRTGRPARLEGSATVSPWTWDDRSMHFRAKWRADHDLLAGEQPFDLPFAVVIGKGVLVGLASMIVNPSGVPTSWGNWWGEGDEKILVDGEASPSIFGTGSEDYFNYSWSRPDLFDHPYCGQPLDSGPDTAGYVSNHRFQVLDAVPFERSLAAYLELWAHTRTPGMSYARIAYHYAAPGAADDHRALAPSDLRIPPLPPRKHEAALGAAGARFIPVEELRPEATAGAVESMPLPIASRNRVAAWRAAKGEKLKLSLPIEEAGRWSICIVAVHRPDGAAVRVLLDGKPLARGDDGEVRLRTDHAARVLNVGFPPVEIAAGKHELVLECVEAGLVGIDYVWVKPER